MCVYMRLLLLLIAVAVMLILVVVVVVVMLILVLVLVRSVVSVSSRSAIYKYRYKSVIKCSHFIFRPNEENKMNYSACSSCSACDRDPAAGSVAIVDHLSHCKFVIKSFTKIQKLQTNKQKNTYELLSAQRRSSRRP